MLWEINLKLSAGFIRKCWQNLNSKDASLKGFTIAGKDQKFVDANAKIIGDNIEVWSDAIANPEAVRFGWQTVPDDNLFNAAGLPATPFRTDNWIVDTQEKK